MIARCGPLALFWYNCYTSHNRRSSCREGAGVQSRTCLCFCSYYREVFRFRPTSVSSRFITFGSNFHKVLKILWKMLKCAPSENRKNDGRIFDEFSILGLFQDRCRAATLYKGRQYPFHYPAGSVQGDPQPGGRAGRDTVPEGGQKCHADAQRRGLLRVRQACSG